MSDSKKKSKGDKGKDKDKKSKSKDKESGSRSATPKRDASASSAPQASLDFEAGVIFNKYDKYQTGVISAEDFLNMWREAREMTKTAQPDASQTAAAGGGPAPALPKDMNPLSVSFEAGQIFQKFDTDKDGRLDKKDFESLLKTHPELVKPSFYGSGNAVNIEPKRPMLPTEVVTGRLLTHYDETAGVAIPHSSVERHRSLGNTVVPLTEAYRARYDRLRSLLTSRLLPRREHLLQLRRQLQVCSSEVAATRKGIERETISDTEQILERLRSVEAMRQSAIKHQVLQLEEELEGIERVVRRIEQANDDGHFQSPSAVLLTSAAPGSLPVETVRGPKAAGMVELIQQFPDLSSSIERMATKTLTVQTDFPTDDFPKETAERLEILSRCDRYVHAVAVKDQMLWTVMKEKERQDELLEEERKLSYEYAQEVTKWAEMSQSLSQQLTAMKQEKENLERKNRELVNALRENNISYVTKD